MKIDANGLKGMGRYLTQERKAVPQDSVLGPILFILFTNYIKIVIKNVNCKCKCKCKKCNYLYADDTLIYAERENEEVCINKLLSDNIRS